MSLLDFIKNRNSQQTSAQQPKPETAKEMYTREATQDRAAAKPAMDLRPDQQAKVAEAKDLYRQGTQQAANDPTVPQAPSEGATAPQPMAQLSMNQDKAAPALSPTSAQAGTRSTEQEAPSSSQTKSQEQAKPTMARRPPSWER